MSRGNSRAAAAAENEAEHEFSVAGSQVATLIFLIRMACKDAAAVPPETALAQLRLSKFNVRFAEESAWVFVRTTYSGVETAGEWRAIFSAFANGLEAIVGDGVSRDLQ